MGGAGLYYAGHPAQIRQPFGAALRAKNGWWTLLGYRLGGDGDEKARGPLLPEGLWPAGFVGSRLTWGQATFLVSLVLRR